MNIYEMIALGFVAILVLATIGGMAITWAMNLAIRKGHLKMEGYTHLDNVEEE